MRLKSVQDVVASHLCVGCGACAYLAGGDALRMVDIPRLGHRPLLSDKSLSPAVERDCLAACPAVATRVDASTTAHEQGVKLEAGPVLEIWEGHATDPAIRFAGASGGALSALAAFAVEKGGMHGVLHIAQKAEDPLHNETVLSRSRAELLSRTGSRYAPASACDRLDLIENAPAPCVFIGQPSEVAALRLARQLRPALDRNVGVALSFFCAGSPSTQGTADLLHAKGIAPETVEQIRYRGRGWPGMFAVWQKGQTEPTLEMTYAESWKFLQAYRPWSVQIWPDGSGEHADISCGDPWYREVRPGEAGSSLVIVRTEKGRQFLRDAIAAGYLELTPADGAKLINSQKNLIRKKGAVWGRLVAMRLMGLPTPRHTGYHLFRNWLRLSLREQLASVVGTARRVLARGYHRPLRLPPRLHEAPAQASAPLAHTP